MIVRLMQGNSYLFYRPNSTMVKSVLSKMRGIVSRTHLNLEQKAPMLPPPVQHDEQVKPLVIPFKIYPMPGQRIPLHILFNWATLTPTHTKCHQIMSAMGREELRKTVAQLCQHEVQQLSQGCPPYDPEEFHLKAVSAINNAITSFHMEVKTLDVREVAHLITPQLTKQYILIMN